jgi:molybdopterin biosynthesis enzyme
VGFEVFLRRALAKLSGADPVHWQSETLPVGRWSGTALAANPRQQHHPVRVSFGEDGVSVLEPLRWRSSADIVGITRADALAVVAPDTRAETGALVPFRRLR